MTSLVLTINGKDRVGLVQSLARAIADHNGNWVESRMAQLAGRFAGLLRVEIAPDAADSLIAQLKGLDLRVLVERGDIQARDAERRTLTLELIGADHPGIVRDITNALAAAGVNIEELETECVPAPMSGEPLFTAEATLSAPRSMTMETLEDTLSDLAADLMVEIRVEQAD